MSRLGKNPIAIPGSVKVNLDKDLLHIEGSKGKLDYKIPPGIKLEVKDNKIMVVRNSNSKQDKSNHGTIWAVISNMIKGVTDGFTKELEIQGVGYRAQIKGKVLNLQLGFSHPVEFPIPEGINITTPKPTQIAIQGIDKIKVGQTAAEIRRIYPPEPYKGKGIRYVGEYVRRKQGKAVTK